MNEKPWFTSYYLIAQIIAQQKVVDESHPDENQLAEMEGRVEDLNKVWQEAIENSRERKEGVTKLNKKIKDIQSNKVGNIHSLKCRSYVF